MDLRALARRALDRPGPPRKVLSRVEMAESVRRIAASGLFDREWYETQSGEHFRTDLVALTHYVRRGRRAGRSPHPLFEPEWYAPDRWRGPAADPFAVYLGKARRPTPTPHPLFDPQVYLDEHPDAARHPYGALGHFAATAADRTLLPLPPELAAGGPLTWGEARRALLDRVAGWREQEGRRTAPRSVPTYDWAADAAYVARWSRAPLPPSEEGPLVSVVLPVRDRATQVVAAIASVRAQTLPDWELLVVDDGSTDATAEVVASLARHDPRVRLLRLPPSGVSRARNEGARQARGRYLAWLDSDNTWLPHFLRTAVAAMAGSGARVAHAAQELVFRTGRRYRTLHGGVELLEVANHVDLNVLVAERALVEQVGGFDESLRRTVDYDLVWRLAKVTDLMYLPFVGVSYAEDRSDADRITMRELKSWAEVVKNKHLIAWADQQAGLPDRVSGRVSVLVPTYEDWSMTWRAVRAVFDRSGEADVEVVVLDNGSRRAVGALLGSWAAVEPRLRVIRSPVNVNFALGSNLAFAASTGEHVVFLNNDTQVRTGWLGPLVEELRRPDVVGVQPLLVYPDDSVQCAGVVFPARGTFPTHFLAHHPADDAVAMGRFPVSAVTGAALAMRPADVVAMRGFDPIYANGWEDVDLCLRLREQRLAERRPGHFVVATDAWVAHHESKTPGRGRHTTENRTVFKERWRDRLPGSDEPLWERAGFVVSHYEAGEPGVAYGLRAGRPVVTRPRRSVRSGPAAGRPALRWAVKIAAVPGEQGLAWGDVHFARALARALQRLGQDVVIDSRRAYERPTSYLDDVVLVLRGLERVTPQPGRVNLLWVISHPDLVTVEEMAAFDAVFAASVPWSARMTGAVGRPVRPLLQATDPERFSPDLAAPDTGHDLLFVGNSRGVVRPIVRDAVAAGFEPAVYGSRWDGFLDPSFIMGSYLPNEQVGAAYRAAGILLNDHWDDMRRDGFVSNRVFDAAATGARVVSDHIEGLEELFGGLVRTYRDPAELADLLSRPRDEVFPPEAERMRLARAVAAEHSFDARARTLLDAALDIWR